MKPTDSITNRSATELAAMIATSEVSARELLDACIARYERLDGSINAVVVERIDAARKAAVAADQAVADRRDLDPLHGVPVTIKEAFDWVDTPTTWGDPRYVGHRAETTAAAPQALIDAGAILWGKTNVPLLLGDWQTFNGIYGTTSNPWNLDHTPGGSSGGSAAAIASGYSALELGSDIGGSIRFPAHYCGVFGHKPTSGVVSQRGHAVPGHPAPVDIVVCGPMARSARDLGLAMNLLSIRSLAHEPHRSLASYRIGVMFENPLGGSRDREMMGLLRAALEALVQAGVTIVDGVDTAIDHVRAYEVYRLLNHAATSHVEARDDEVRQAQRYDDGERDYASRFGKGARLTHREWLALNDERETFRQQWRELFRSVDAVVCPASATPAPHHATHESFGPQNMVVDGQEVSVLDQWFWAALASGVDLPSTVAPVGLTSAGLPVGIQILGPHGGDHRTIALAGHATRLTGGWRAPPLD